MPSIPICPIPSIPSHPIHPVLSRPIPSVPSHPSHPIHLVLFHPIPSFLSCPMTSHPISSILSCSILTHPIPTHPVPPVHPSHPTSPHPTPSPLTLLGPCLPDPPDGFGDLEVVVGGQGPRRLPQLGVTQQLLGDLRRRPSRSACGKGTGAGTASRGGAPGHPRGCVRAPVSAQLPA